MTIHPKNCKCERCMKKRERQNPGLRSRGGYVIGVELLMNDRKEKVEEEKKEEPVVKEEKKKEEPVKEEKKKEEPVKEEKKKEKNVNE